MSGDTPEKLQLNDTNISETTVKPADQIEEFSWRAFYKSIAYWCLQAYTVFLITYLLFPGTILSTKLDFLENHKSRQSLFDIIMVTLNALMDTCGSYSAGLYIAFSYGSVKYLTLGRAIFIPLSIFIQLALSPSWLFQADWFRILNVTFLSFTNGYNIALVMTYGPQSVPDNQKERAGMLMNFHLMAGLCTSSMISAFLMSLIPQNSHY